MHRLIAKFIRYSTFDQCIYWFAAFQSRIIVSAICACTDQNARMSVGHAVRDICPSFPSSFAKGNYFKDFLSSFQSNARSHLKGKNLLKGEQKLLLQS